MGVVNHTPGLTRYITYQLEFKDGDMWTDQEEFWGPLDTYLKLTTFAKRKDLCRDLLVKGQTHWKDPNGVTHRVIIEAKKRPRVWGTGKKKR